jgi:hypothetical protein
MTTDLLCDMVPTGLGREHRCMRCGQRATPGGNGPVRIRASCLATLRHGSPSLVQRAWNLGNALASFVGDGLHTVDRATYAARLAACNHCDRRRDEQCQECGCRIALKAHARVWDCPIGRWPGGADYLPPQAAERMAVCRTCDQLQYGVCTLGGMDAKAAALRPEASCPRRVWPGEGGHQPIEIPQGDARRLLLVFPHGFGDHVQLTTVLLHLKRHRPGWIVDVVCRPGAASLYRGLCRRALPWSLPRDEPYDQTVTLPWFEPRETYPDSPSTKAEKCLREVFGIQPDEELCRYEIQPTLGDFDAARAYLRRVCSGDSDGRFPVVLLHYQGRSGERVKSITPAVAQAIVDRVRVRGLVPICLDWDAKCPLVAAGQVENCGGDRQLWPDGHGDGGRMAALASLSRFNIGIDSGPGHVFAAVPTPAVIFSWLLHPVNYFGLAEHVLFLVPQGHGRFIKGDRATGERYFVDHYPHRVYQDMAADVPEFVEQALAAALEQPDRDL